MTTLLTKPCLTLVLLICALPAAAEKNAWFNKSSKLLLAKEMNTCQAHKNAGNNALFNECVTSKLNAYDVINQKMNDPAVSPLIGESVCVDKIRFNFEYGARCMASASEICKQDSAGNIPNALGCLRTFSNPGWLANPAAMKLDLTRPARKEEEISKYLQQ